MKKLFVFLLSFAALQATISAQFAISLSEGCATFNEVKVKGKITYPASDFNICAYTVELLDMHGNKVADIKVNEKTPQGGHFDFSGKVPSGKSVTFPCKIKVTTNRQTSATIDVKQYCGAVRLKNRWKADQYINMEKDLAASAVQPVFLSAQWELIPVQGTHFYQIKNVWKPGQYLNIEKGPLVASDIPVGFFSGHWELETVAGAESFVRLKSRWKRRVTDAVQSANWTVEKAW